MSDFKAKMHQLRRGSVQTPLRELAALHLLKARFKGTSVLRAGGKGKKWEGTQLTQAGILRSGPPLFCRPTQTVHCTASWNSGQLDGDRMTNVICNREALKFCSEQNATAPGLPKHVLS